MSGNFPYSNQPFEDPQLTASRPPPPATQDQYGTIFLGGSGQYPGGSGQYMASSGTLPLNVAPPPTAPRGHPMPPSAGRPMDTVGSQGGNPDGGGRLSTGLLDVYGTSPGLQPSTMPQQAGLRSLPGDRIVQSGSVPMRSEARSAPPAVFTTSAIPQMRTQESTATMSAMGATEEENDYLHQRVEQLENELYQSQNLRSRAQELPAADSRDVALLQHRLREAQESEASALRAHEARLHEINELERQMRDQQAHFSGSQSAGEVQKILVLQQQLDVARRSEAVHRQRVEEQAVQLQEKSLQIARSQGGSASLQQERGDLEQKCAAAQRENEELKRLAAQKAAELEHSKRQQPRSKDVEKKLPSNLEDNYQKQVQEDRKTINQLQQQLDSERKAKENVTNQAASQREQLINLESEVSYRKELQTFHQKQGDTHSKEVQRLKRLREEDAPPPFIPRMPLKALEERVMNLACFTMMAICALPMMGAIAVLNDENYVFWLGKTWPFMVLGGCIAVFVVFCVTVQLLFQWALPEHRSQFTMAFTLATFAALLGVVLVPISLMANKEAINIASTISQGCLTAMPQSEMLVDYSQVLYNIRLSQNCSSARSVTECEGFSYNKYTKYLEYLEGDFHCGPLCPESPPPARAVHAPQLHNNVAAMMPAIPPPNDYAPPLQNALGSYSAFLQAAEGLVGRNVQRHEHKVLPPSSGVMETSLPHMQAKKLFSEGNTRMTCYPLIATRLQVLVSTFGGLWYWEGMGLIIVSLCTSLYAGLFFASSMI